MALCKVHVEASHWPCDNYGPKTICHHFQPGLIPMPNPLGTYWELMEILGNFLWTPKKTKKSSFPYPPKKNNEALLFLCWAFSLAVWNFISKTVRHHFSPGLMESMGEYGCIGVERFQIPLQAYCRHTWNRPWSTYNQLAGRFSFHCSQMKLALIHHHQVPTPSQNSNSISAHNRKMTWTCLDEFQLLCSVQLSLGLYMRP
jgi:hypothetical protein